MTSPATPSPARALTGATLLGLILFTPTWALAQKSVQLQVTGIIKPGACMPAISGQVDYGTILNHGNELNVTSSPVLPHLEYARALAPRTVTLSVTCTAAMPVAIVVKDNKAATKVTGLASKASPRATEASMFSLDATGQAQHGAFHLAMISAQAGGQPVDIISAPIEANPQWSHNEGGAMATDRQLSWAARGQTTPGAWTAITGQLQVTPVLQGALDRSQDIKLNGSATIEIRYL